MELLLPGRPVYLVRERKEETRKTAYTMVAVERNRDCNTHLFGFPDDPLYREDFHRLVQHFRMDRYEPTVSGLGTAGPGIVMEAWDDQSGNTPKIGVSR